jgi:hypothetical protein
MRRRGERIERSFAHVYDTGGMRRTHLRGHANILKRLLIHAGGFNLGLVMRQLIGIGTPRGLQDMAVGTLAALMEVIHLVLDLITVEVTNSWSIPEWGDFNNVSSPSRLVTTEPATCTTGC